MISFLQLEIGISEVLYSWSYSICSYLAPLTQPIFLL